MSLYNTRETYTNYLGTSQNLLVTDLKNFKFVKKTKLYDI